MRKILIIGTLVAGVPLATSMSCGGNEQHSQVAGDTTAVAVDTVATVEVAPAEVKKYQFTEISPAHANKAATYAAAARQALMQAYPDFIKDVKDNTVYFTDGTTMQYDDGKAKDWNTMLDNSDIEDMFFVPYDSQLTPPPYLYDPGRSRSEALYKKMYGNSATAVSKNLKTVKWFGQNVRFTTVNGAADSLAKVAAEIAKHPELVKYTKSSGTFYWRTVRGATRQSAHSYAIAFDIGVSLSYYWRNKASSETARVAYQNKHPRELVEIFERHGFIWGGAWYHYDTMHFEFRPELLIYSRLVK